MVKKQTIDILLTQISRTTQILSVASSDPAMNAARLMTEAGVGLVLVIDNGKLVGVISERDIVGKWVCHKDFPKVPKVSDIMSKNVEVVTPQDTIFDCYLRFSARNCRHLPVLDPFGQVLGVLSMRDVTSYVVSQLSE